MSYSIDQFSGFERFHGSQEDDVLGGANERDQTEWFYGGHGDDLFIGSKGTDHFDGGSDKAKYGEDNGLDGFDTVSYASFLNGMHVDLDKEIGWVKPVNGILPAAETYNHTYEQIDGVIGSRYSDRLIGDYLDNMIAGGGGADTMTGGAGGDTFVFKKTSGWAGVDKITDFVSGDDTLELHSMAMILGAGGGVAHDFADLDSNGHGALNAADASMVSYAGSSYLMFANTFIELEGVLELKASDIVFA